MKAHKKPIFPGVSRFLMRKNQVYILPTRMGLLYGLLILTSLILSEAYASTDLYVFTALLTTLGIMAMLMTNSNLKKLSCVLDKELLCAQGTRGPFPLTAKNSKKDGCHAVDIQVQIEGEKHPVLLHQIEGQSSELLHWYPATTLKRGRYPIKTLRVTSRFPLGLFYSWMDLPVHCELLIYPHPLKGQMIHAFESHDRREELASDRADTGDEDFHSLRDYVPQENQKKIAWKTFARSEKLLVKTFSGLESRSYTFSWRDFRENDPELQLKILCSLVHAANEAQVSYSLELPKVQITSSSGRAHFRRCLKELARHES